MLLAVYNAHRIVAVTFLFLSSTVRRRGVTMKTAGIGCLFLLSFATLVSSSPAAAQGNSGMAAPSDAPKSSAGQTRTYYIAADELAWDYVPGGMDNIAGTPFKSVGVFIGGSGTPPVEKPVPTSYLKALYREYTDDTFHTLKPRLPEWEHLGFMGPLIRAEVGDTIRIVFRNNGHHPYSMHPHGVFYNKDSEGAPYDDGTSGGDKADDAVPPGGTHEYTWQVPERAGPGPGDVNSVMWMYHSHTNEYRDPNSGLVGPMLITARGQAKPDGSPKGVDREFVVWFSQVHEEDSWFVEQNLPTIGKDGAIPSPLTSASTTLVYPHFVKFSINGFSHGSLPLRALTMRKGEHVRWYLFSGINDFDFHTPHWHGNTVVVNQMRTDVTSMAPMQMVTADMVPDDPGIWLFHCHISFHNAGGMTARYAVTP
jgi:FtsP/CotA-like multicopper oxidase with cupredoxin domain